MAYEVIDYFTLAQLVLVGDVGLSEDGWMQPNQCAGRQNVLSRCGNTLWFNKESHHISILRIRHLFYCLLSTRLFLEYI